MEEITLQLVVEFQVSNANMDSVEREESLLKCG
jgi:hypothetical protein